MGVVEQLLVDRKQPSSQVKCEFKNIDIFRLIYLFIFAITIDTDIDFAFFHLRTLTEAETKVGLLQKYDAYFLKKKLTCCTKACCYKILFIYYIQQWSYVRKILDSYLNCMCIFRL